KFLFVEAGEVVLRSILHRVVILKISLQNYFARRVATPGASRNLGEELKRTLGGTKVRQPQSRIRAHHSDQRYAVDVMPLRNHLCAHQQIEFAFTQRVERALEI